MDLSVKRHLQMLLESVEGLCQVFITDRDGVPIVHAAAQNSPNTFLRPQLLTAYSVALEQSSKLGLGTQKHMTCLYNGFQVVMMNCAPLMVTLIATSAANTGLILSLREDLEPILKQVQAATADALP